MIKLETKIKSAPVVFALNKLRTVHCDKAVKIDINKSIPTQGYSIRIEDKIYVSGGDDAGCMYGIFDIFHTLQRGEQLVTKNCSPFIPKRGIKFNIPLDSRTPSYSDAGTSARLNIGNMWDMSFWIEFLDRMAENNYNILSLWSLNPFPSMVIVPGFEKASLDDVKVSTRSFHAKLSGKGIFDRDHEENLYTVKKISIKDKIDFWRNVMRYAEDRCIEVFLFTWNLFAEGRNLRQYGITEDPNNTRTKQYFYNGTKALLDTYPLLSGIGVTAGENLTFNGRDDKLVPFEKTDIGFIYETYGKAIDDYLEEHPTRNIVYIHRMQMAKYEEITHAYKNFKGKLEISFKYSQAHMFSSTKPGFINDFLQEKGKNVKLWLTVRNDDFYMFRWGNPDFAREYIKNMPISCMSGFYIGADGFTWGRDYMTVGSNIHPLFIDKMWYAFNIWGELAFNPDITDNYFVDGISLRFRIPYDKALDLFIAWKEASEIISDFNCTHWHDFDFQWYPEGCCMYLNDIDKMVFANIHEFMNCDAMPFTDYLSVKEYASKVISRERITGTTPIDTVKSIHSHIELASEKTVGLSDYFNPELKCTIDDIKMMCLLGSYYSLKEEAAFWLSLYQASKEKEFQGKAISLLQEAAPIWKKYSSFVTSRYYPQELTRLCSKVDLREFDRQAELDIDLAKEAI